MKRGTTTTPAFVTDEKLFDNWFDPIEMELRTKVRGFIEVMIEEGMKVIVLGTRRQIEQMKGNLEE